MNMMKRVSSLALALLLVLSLSVTAFAADEPAVVYSGHKLFSITPAVQTYTRTDLFGSFKGVMPGDKLHETIEVKNTAKCCDYVKVYLYAVPHDSEDNPISDKVLDELTADARRQQEAELSYMLDFLAQLPMTVKNTETGEVIFNNTADQAAQLDKKVLLGTFKKGQGTTLDVTLEVPLTLDNKYAFRVGEVDWVFLVEEYIKDSPATGDHNNATPAIVLLGVGLAGMLLLAAGKRRKKQA